MILTTDQATIVMSMAREANGSGAAFKVSFPNQKLVTCGYEGMVRVSKDGGGEGNVERYQTQRAFAEAYGVTQ